MTDFDPAKVPHGDYCYTILGQRVEADGRVVMRVERCPYWVVRQTAEGEEPFCTHLGEWTPSIENQAKDCGVNVGDEQGVE